MPSAQEPIVIAGGGIVADRCAFALRALGFDGPIRIFAAEPVRPYNRTMVTKGVLTGQVAPTRALLRQDGAYADEGIELALGTPALGIDVAGRHLITSEGPVPYGRLLICTGGQATVPPALDVPGALTIRSLRDATRLREALPDHGRLAIVGGGFVGGEVASAAAAAGLDVTLVEACATPLAPLLGEQVGALVSELHRQSGVDVVCGRPVSRIRGVRGAYTIELADGEEIAAAVVVVAVGMTPDVGWLAETGLDLRGGVPTDAAGRTELPGVFAAGDCATRWSPRYGAPVRVEHWDTAMRHGAAVAETLAGCPAEFDPVPFFWSEQHGVRFQWVGRVSPGSDVRVDIEERDPPRGFLARYVCDGRLVAAFGAGAPREIASLRNELEASAGRASGDSLAV
jgi:3-phenylpropionate/trans-cinnamate dioxygenase ferredoxin reductase subunit